jgi:predicted SPOUT superfamily RNA methylase MTH1
MFGESVARFFDIFQVDGVYFISKGKLKPANKKFVE